jgi:DNA modification methylase
MEAVVVEGKKNGAQKSPLTGNRCRPKDGIAKEIKIEVVDISSLREFERNAREHTDEQVDLLDQSIENYGLTKPPLIDKEGVIVAGHGVIRALKRRGTKRIPVIRLRHLTEKQVREYRLADNKLAEKSKWNDELLAEELRDIVALDLDCEIAIPGFETGQIDFLLQGHDLNAIDEADEVPEINPSDRAVSREDDLWIFGRRHRLLCGDARKERSFKRLMKTDKARMVFTDAPYNRDKDQISGLGRIKHPNFAMASGEMSAAQFIVFLVTVLRLLAMHSVDGSIHEIFMDWRHMDEILAAGRRVYSELKNLCIWVKDNGGMGSLFRSRHELVFVFKNGSASHVNNVELGKHGRNRTNVWCYPGVNTMRPGRLEELAMHPTVKPIALVADAIMDCSGRGDIVLDCFGGSGTTLIAAEKTGRRAYLVEIDPAYVDVTIERYQKVTGQAVIHDASGLTFDQLKAEHTDGGSR